MLESLRAIIGNRTFGTIAIASGFYSGGMALVVEAVMCLFLWTHLVRRRTALPMWRVALGILMIALALMCHGDT